MMADPTSTDPLSGLMGQLGGNLPFMMGMGLLNGGSLDPMKLMQMMMMQQLMQGRGAQQQPAPGPFSGQVPGTAQPWGGYRLG